MTLTGHIRSFAITIPFDSPQNADMNSTMPFAILMRWFMALAALIAMGACASGPEVVDHAFGFSTSYDRQEGIEILDYSYGNSKLPVRAPEWAVKEGKIFRGDDVHGPMLRGEFLYVKWRVADTGMIYQDTVDLRNRLPTDIKDHRVTFIIRGSQLYVYLITPKKRAKDDPPNGPKMYDDLRTLTIYPDKAKP